MKNNLIGLKCKPDWLLSLNFGQNSSFEVPTKVPLLEDVRSHLQVLLLHLLATPDHVLE